MKLSLRWKLVGGYGVLLALIALLGWVTLSLFSSFQSVQREVFDDAIPGVITVDEIVRSYTAQSDAVRGFLIESQPGLIDTYEDEKGIADFYERRAGNYFESAEERALLEDLIEDGHAFQRLVDEEVIPLASRGQRTQAFRVLGQDGTSLLAQIQAAGRSLGAAQDGVVAVAESDLERRTNQAIAILLLVTVGALLVGIALAIGLPRRLVRNLSELVEATRAIGRGDLDQEVSIESGDEVEELAIRFREMQAGLKRLQQLALQDRELEIAANIQRNLLQRTLPKTPGIRLTPLQRQANLVGGDWYDVELVGGSLTVVVGDASGKGIAAALMATVALSVLRAERGLGAGPARILERANDALKNATDREQFTTLIYTSIDMSRGTVEWLNMGHPSPFLLRSHDKEFEIFAGRFMEGPRNRAMGWFDDPGLASHTITLEAGDRPILYTDGFIEAKSPEGEVFGEHRFAEALVRLAPLGPEAMVDAVVGEVEAFAAGKLDDDLTMLVVEFQGSPLIPGEPAVQSGEEPWHSRR